MCIRDSFSARNLCLPENVINLISIFLSNRSQRVQWNNSTTNLLPISSGVPQGSILGPILFSIVVDDFQPVCQNTKVIEYADDINIMHFIRDASDDQLQVEWNHYEAWSESNRLPLNYSKCEILDIITKRGLRTKQGCGIG